MKQVYLNINNDLINDIFNLDDPDEYVIDDSIIELLEGNAPIKVKTSKKEKVEKKEKESKKKDSKSKSKTKKKVIRIRIRK